MDILSTINQYKSIRPQYVLFTKKLENLLKTLLKIEKINYQLVESRTKTFESLEEKMIKKGGKYNDPLLDIKDFSGLRIILYYQKDTELIDALIKKSFSIDTKNTINKKDTLNSNEFGYLANHYVVKMKSSRTNLPEWKLFKNMYAEIQVRTVLQHAWASISHELQYKSKSEIPSALKRKLYRLASLFELADEELGTVKEKQKELNEAIRKKEKISNAKVYDEINFETLSLFFNADNKIIKFYTQQAKKAGFLLQKINSEKDFTEIIYILKALPINNINEFEKFLNTNKDKALSYFKLQYEAKEKDISWIGSGEFIIRLFLLNFLSKKKLNEYLNNKDIEKRWSKKIFNRIKSVILEEKG